MPQVRTPINLSPDQIFALAKVLPPEIREQLAPGYSAKARGAGHTLDELAESFLEQSFAEDTYRTYASVLKSAIPRIEAAVGKDRVFLEDVTRSALILWRTDRESEVKPSTLQKEIGALRSMLNHAVAREWIDRSPAKGLTVRIPVDRFPIRYLSPEQCEALKAEALKTRAPIRNHAIITLMVGLGLRTVEVCGLKASDVDLRAGSISIMGKGNKERLLPLTSDVSKTLSDYMEMCMPTSWLFPTRSGQQMGRRNLLEIVDGLLEKVQRDAVRKVSGAHVLRHSFALNALLRGISLRTIQYMLGHATLGTTGIYLRLTPDMVRKDLEDHPFERLKGV